MRLKFLGALACVAAFAAGPVVAATPCGQDWRPEFARHGFDGRTVFPIGVWLQSPDEAERYREIGVNLYVGLWKGPTRAQLDRLREAGMPVLGEPTEAARDPAYADVVAGWLLPDEPDNAQRLPDGSGYGPPIPPEDVVALYCDAARIAPPRPVLLQLGMGVGWEEWKGRGVRTGRLEDYPEYARGADIVSFDIYPVTSRIDGLAGRIDRIGVGMSRLRDWKAADQPAWMAIGLSRIGNPDVLPTPEQMRAQIWMALVHGAEGLIYFVHQFRPTRIEAALFEDAAGMAAIKAENARIQSLAPVLLSPTVAGAATVVSGDVALMTKDHGDRRYIFAVSMSGAPQEARIAVADAPETAARLESGEPVRLDGGVIADAFPAYGHRAYVFAKPK